MATLLVAAIGILFTVVGLVLIRQRRSLAEAQSLLAGARVPPGCVVIEGIGLIIVAIAFAILHAAGIFP